MTNEEIEQITKKYRGADPNNICEIHKSIEPKFKAGDTVIINSKNGPIITIEKHYPDELRGFIRTFKGMWVGEYYTSVKTTDSKGITTEAIQPFRIKFNQEMYEKV